MFRETLTGKIGKTAHKRAVETGGEKEGVSWKNVDSDGDRPYLREMWEYFLQERSRVKRSRELADEEKEAGMQGQWQQDTAFKRVRATSEMLSRYGLRRTNDEEKFHRLEEWDMGSVQGNLATPRLRNIISSDAESSGRGARM